MKIIKCLSEMIEDELDGACEYVQKAIEYKTKHPQLADVLYTLSTEEMKHMTILHDQVTKLIQEYRTANGEPPASMQAVYDYLHEKYMDKAAKIKAYQEVYKMT